MCLGMDKAMGGFGRKKNEDRTKLFALVFNHVTKHSSQ